VLEDAKGSATPDVIVRDVLARAFPGKELRDQKTFSATIMTFQGLARIKQVA
jgi:hypothetical protein